MTLDAARRGLASARKGRGSVADLRRVAEAFELAAERSPHDPLAVQAHAEALARLGHALKEAGDLDEARGVLVHAASRCKDALAHAPEWVALVLATRAGARSILGDVLATGKRDDEARESFLAARADIWTALDLAPDRQDLLTFSNTTDIEDAIEIMGKRAAEARAQ